MLLRVQKYDQFTTASLLLILLNLLNFYYYIFKYDGLIFNKLYLFSCCLRTSTEIQKDHRPIFTAGNFADYA